MADRPFQGSSMQTAGRAGTSGAGPGDTEGPTVLPLEAAVDAIGGGWSVRLPVRAEHVTVNKEAILLEEVRLWRSDQVEDRPVTATVRSERLHLESQQDQR